MMHTEKNINEALFGTVMDISNKTKDNVKARVDQARLCNRPKLNIPPPRDGKKWKKTSSQSHPDKAPEEESTRMVSNFNISRWICSESEEGGELNYNANQWAQES